MNQAWADKAIFYHIYPLGLCGAPKHNDFQSPPVQRLEKLYPWLDHIQSLGCTALYLGPLFESSVHGYDTADYFQVDRRLGSRETLANLSSELHHRGLKLVLDGVFNHTGRDFWAFKDLQARLEHSAYVSWFHNIDFSRASPYQDPFNYEGWSGHYDLVKLNLANLEVRSHIFEAVRFWIEAFDIDGLRLDAADQISPDFLTALRQFCRELRPDFWLMGEMVGGDYRSLANPALLDSVTNYEVYKSLYSSHIDQNYFEIAYSLNRQFGPGGIYRQFAPYNFADNHDVNRVASSLKNPSHLYPLYCLLFTLPGIPSIYYGSEWGLAGLRTPTSDDALRPQIDLTRSASFPHYDLASTIARLAQIRHQNAALSTGEYSQLYVTAEQFAFLRSLPAGQVVVAVNASNVPSELNLQLPVSSGLLEDQLNAGQTFSIVNHRARLSIPPTWGRILAVL
jgi:cyclomaltodextrinase